MQLTEKEGTEMVQDSFPPNKHVNKLDFPWLCAFHLICTIIFCTDSRTNKTDLEVIFV